MAATVHNMCHYSNCKLHFLSGTVVLLEIIRHTVVREDSQERQVAFGYVRPEKPKLIYQVSHSPLCMEILPYFCCIFDVSQLNQRYGCR